MTQHPKLAAKRRRIQRIRASIAAVAAALFIAVFSTIYVQMAAGNDPALGASATRTAQVTTTSTGTSSSASTSSDDSSGSSAMTTSAS